LFALFASDEYDKGHIIKNEKVTIEYPIKIKVAIEKIAPLNGERCLTPTYQVIV